MVVLLIGGKSRFMDILIQKLNKGRHQVYLLTGNRYSKSAYPHVFEKFDFPYDSDSIGQIFTSIHPDVTVFFGAYDTNFHWEDERKESVRYMTGLSNILSAFSLNGQGRFLYFSSQEVYGKNYGADITEDTPTSAVGFRAMALAQGEALCRSYQETRGTNALILRFDNLYGEPKKEGLERNPCYKTVLEMLKTNQISANHRRAFSLLYLTDAAEFVYTFILSPGCQHFIYNLSSKEVLSQAELARLIEKHAGAGTKVTDVTVGEEFRVVLSPARYEKEFPHRIFVPCEEGIKRTTLYMKKHSRQFLTKEDLGAGWGSRTWRTIKRIFLLLVPYLENLMCFLPFFMLNNRAVSSPYYNKLDFYLLYVLLFAIVYGQQQAIFSAILATVGYCFRQMYDKSGFEVLMDYSTYVWIAQLFILGMVVGYMKDKIRHIREEDTEEIRYLEGQLGDITDINDSNVRMKHLFEQQLINQKDSLGKIYSITSELDQYGPEEVLFYAAKVLSDLMDTNDVAIYTVANGDYARLFSFTSDTARKMGNSIKYTDLTELYAELKEQRVYINKTLDARYPLMAAAVYEEDRMQIIMMLWGLPWERMNLAESNRLMIVGRLVQNATIRASRYLEALKDNRYLRDSKVLEVAAFTQLVKAFFDAKSKGLTECSLIRIEKPGSTWEEAAGELVSLLRQSDYLGLLQDGLYVLLPNTDAENARWVITRFEEKGCIGRLTDREDVKC